MLICCQTVIVIKSPCIRKYNSILYKFRKRICSYFPVLRDYTVLSKEQVNFHASVSNVVFTF